MINIERKYRNNDDFIRELKIKRPTILPLETYTGIDNKIKCQCLVCNDIFYTTPYILLNGTKGNGCKKCNGTKKKTHFEYIQELIDKHISVMPLEQYQGTHTKIKHKCNICSYEWNAKPVNILSGYLCPVCTNKEILIGYNDLWHTHPQIAKLLLDTDDGYKYTYGSGIKVNWKCPNCGFIGKYSIKDIVKSKHIPCKKCSDGISYPMKFMMSILNQLNVNYSTEVKFNWCKYIFKGNETYGIYDIVFDHNYNNYIIEIDGSFHFKNNKMNGHTIEDSQILDALKDNCAIKNGYKIIRITKLRHDHRLSRWYE